MGRPISFSFAFLAVVVTLSVYGALFVAMYGADLGDPAANPLAQLKDAGLRGAWLVKNLPSVNAVLNLLTMLLLGFGLLSIRAGKTKVHVGFMVAALGASFLFGANYLTYHFFYGHTTFSGVGPLRVFYFATLTTHTLACVLLVPMVVFLVGLALTKRFAAHKTLARWVYPLWYYVLATGLVIYALLYL